MSFNRFQLVGIHPVVIQYPFFHLISWDPESISEALFVDRHTCLIVPIFFSAVYLEASIPKEIQLLVQLHMVVDTLDQTICLL